MEHVVEQIFGVIQERFKILISGCDYDLQLQANVFPALAVIHNFISLNDPDDLIHPDDMAEWIGEPSLETAGGELSNTAGTTRAEKERGEDMREKVAQTFF
ncbi:unnamed protein product [Tilletia caries]|uniref:DDE Tnp4 domain-containing protein n=2 Tax=Tilletia TaxID=13289 RepID=A0A8X7MPA0_9BASI|nr:hypothetical protein CF336_g5698 [Tilletia laevis]KAE8194804.1 hypothetical protein CF328_g4632 [Tilletia controversa]KAE8252837.1 hypothetical protein A4X03_0g6062 [Tilletia caries]KAE8196451.1 hypothetical protein CF335_g4859 [Tilletia laevis]KAE8243762.1 hypothetical protein A4X06_0g6117 [Tilletia controversa]